MDIIQELKLIPEKMSDEFTKYYIDINLDKWKPFHVVLHHFTAKDIGGPHDHPWGFNTYIISGGYIERVYHVTEWGTYYSKLVEHKAGTVFTIKATHIHEIIELIGGECWTLVTPSPWERDWGFWNFDGEKPVFRPFKQ